MEGPMATLPADFDLVDDNFFALHIVDEGDDVGGLKKKLPKYYRDSNHMAAYPQEISFTALDAMVS